MNLTHDKLSGWLRHLDDAPVECDGMVHLLANKLRKRQIPFQAKQGMCEFQGKTVTPHFWIVVDRWTIDYRLQMWLGCNQHIPHGVFQADLYPRVLYSGSDLDLPVLPQCVYDVLML